MSSASVPVNPHDRVLAIKALPRFTRRTIASVTALRRELAIVRKPEDNEENEVGGRCVAARFRNASGEVVAAVSASGPRTRIADRSMKAAARGAIDATERLSQLLGGKGTEQ